MSSATRWVNCRSGCKRCGLRTTSALTVAYPRNFTCHRIWLGPRIRQPPESILWNNLRLLQKRTALVYGQSLLQKMPPDSEFFRRVHRFYCESFEDVCELCKELHRIVCEPIDLGLLNSKIDPANAETANKQGLRQIKRLALWLNTLKFDGRKITQALAGIADLRQGDAHAKSSELRESLKLFAIPTDCTTYQPMCCEIIGQVA